MKKPKTPPTEDQIRESIRLRELFAERAGMSQLEFGQAYGIGNQGMVWQYLNADKPKGSVLNVFAAMKFAEGLHCRVSDFSPSIQKEIDRIAVFSSKAEEDTAMKKEFRPPPDPGKPVTNEPAKMFNTDNIPPKGATQKEVVVGGMYAKAPEESRAAIDVILLNPNEREMLRESGDGSMAISAIDILERTATSALSALSERKKAKNGTKSD